VEIDTESIILVGLTYTLSDSLVDT